VEEAADGSEIGGDRIDERGDVVLRLALELGDAFRRGDRRAFADLACGIARDRADFSPAVEGG
jgi:hypothetical protein